MIIIPLKVNEGQMFCFVNSCGLIIPLPTLYIITENGLFETVFSVFVKIVCRCEESAPEIGRQVNAHEYVVFMYNGDKEEIALCKWILDCISSRH